MFALNKIRQSSDMCNSDKIRHVQFVIWVNVVNSAAQTSVLNKHNNVNVIFANNLNN